MDWLRLVRISALPTAISNILVGFLISNESWQPIGELVLLIIAGCCFYMSGMILNDWFDVERDAQQRPGRPLPAGRISRPAALFAALFLIGTGLLLAGMNSFVSLFWSIALVVAIVAYDGVLKQTYIAPIAMGACRTFNILLGASSGLAAAESHKIVGFDMPTLWIALSLGLFITGLTWFARHEATGARRGVLIGGTLVMLGGMVGYILAPIQFEIAASDGALKRYMVIVALIFLPIFWRCYLAIKQAVPGEIGAAVATALRSLILLDAAVAYLFSQCQVFYPLAILSLLIPALLLARWISPT